MFEKLRKNVFWLKDSFFGNIREHYEDIDAQMQGATLGTSYLELLPKLLSHASLTVPYYSKHTSGYSSLSLDAFPVINKSVIKQNYDDFLSSLYAGRKLHSMSTSGSTGTPFKILQCKSKRERVLAELIYFNKQAKQNIGDRFMYFRVWTEANKKSFFAQMAQNIICVDILKLDQNTFKNILYRVEHDSSLTSCLGYAHTFEYFCRFVEDTKGKINPPGLKSIITSSEVMSLDMKRRIKVAIGCDVYDRYSNQENGLIAQSENCSDLFAVNHSSYLVEILQEDTDAPVNDGEIGRIVVTDLFNYAMPLIRYDTGDLAVKVGSERFSSTLRAIQGRQVDVIYDCRGSTLTPHALTNHMWGFDRLSQYQFIQEDEKNYILKVVGAEGKYSDEDFLAVLLPILGEDAKINIDYISAVPVLASGKFKKIICNYRPK